MSVTVDCLKSLRTPTVKKDPSAETHSSIRSSVLLPPTVVSFCSIVLIMPTALRAGAVSPLLGKLAAVMRVQRDTVSKAMWQQTGALPEIIFRSEGSVSISRGSLSRTVQKVQKSPDGCVNLRWVEIRSDESRSLRAACAPFNHSSSSFCMSTVLQRLPVCGARAGGARPSAKGRVSVEGSCATLMTMSEPRGNSQGCVLAHSSGALASE